MELPKDIKWTIAKHLDYFDTIKFLPNCKDDVELWRFKNRDPRKYDPDPKRNYMIGEAYTLYYITINGLENIFLKFFKYKVNPQTVIIPKTFKLKIPGVDREISTLYHLMDA